MARNTTIKRPVLPGYGARTSVHPEKANQQQAVDDGPCPAMAIRRYFSPGHKSLMVHLPVRPSGKRGLLILNRNTHHNNTQQRNQ